MNEAGTKRHHHTRPRWWSEGEQTLLALMLADGAKPAEVARSLERSKTSVLCRMRRTGLSRKVVREVKGWTPAEDAMLFAALKQGTPANAIASIPGRTPLQAQSRLQTLRRNGGRRLRATVYALWRPEEVSRLAEWRTLGVPRLARMLGRTEAAVAMKMYRTGIRKRRPNAWSEADEATFRSLRREGRNYEEIGAALGRSPGAVQVRRHRLRQKALRRTQTLRPHEVPGIHQERVF